jgi:hypothetical protein
VIQVSGEKEGGGQQGNRQVSPKEEDTERGHKDESDQRECAQTGTGDARTERDRQTRSACEQLGIVMMNEGRFANTLPSREGPASIAHDGTRAKATRQA